MKFLRLPGFARAGNVLLFFAIIVYAAWGVPTPSQAGSAEAVVGALLILAVLASRPWALGRDFWTFWLGFGAAFLCFGLCGSLTIGIVHGHEPAAIMRDFIAFMFLMMPVLLAGLRQEFFILHGILLLGVLFSIRALHLDSLGILGEARTLDYLENMPSVLMTALYCAGIALSSVAGKLNARSLIKGALSLVCSMLCLMPAVATTQRASLGAFAAGVCIFLLFYVWHVPRRALCVIGMAAICAAIFSESLMSLMNIFIVKNMMVGTNMRLEELAAVWSTVSENPVSLFLGQGWGAHYPSPAVAGISVNYTHSLLSAVLLKSGVVGVVMTGLYLGFLMAHLLKKGWPDMVLVVSILFPVLIDSFLYASYKSFDFGLLLLLASGAALRHGGLPRLHPHGA